MNKVVPLVVAVDGRPASLQALEWAAAEAAAQGVELWIVHVVRPEWSVQSVPCDGYPASWRAGDNALQMGALAVARARTVAPSLTVSFHLRTGSTPRELRGAASEASLLVLGGSGTRRRWSSTLLERLLRKSRIPIAVIGLHPSRASCVDNEHAGRVLLVLDEQPLEHPAVVTALIAARQRGTDVVLLPRQQASGPASELEVEPSGALHQRHWNSQALDKRFRAAAGAALVVVPMSTPGHHRSAVELCRQLAPAPVLLVPAAPGFRRRRT
jgi:nucleotide-binding universal stress UspA family protein